MNDQNKKCGVHNIYIYNIVVYILTISRLKMSNKNIWSVLQITRLFRAFTVRDGAGNIQ